MEANEELMQDNIDPVVEDSDGSSINEENTNDSQPDEITDLPKKAKERLGRQEKKHQREMRALRNEMMAAIENIGAMNNRNEPDEQPELNSDEDAKLQRAVNFALQQREIQEKKAIEAANKAHVHGRFKELSDHLNDYSDKYDDFHDIVIKESGAPFTEAAITAALILPKTGPGSAAEVLYKLGKNKAELERINKLHPLDQTQEMIKLGYALMAGSQKGSSNNDRLLNPIRNNPTINSNGISENTSINELRKLLK